MHPLRSTSSMGKRNQVKITESYQTNYHRHTHRVKDIQNRILIKAPVAAWQIYRPLPSVTVICIRPVQLQVRKWAPKHLTNSVCKLLALAAQIIKGIRLSLRDIHPLTRWQRTSTIQLV